ncbi:MAG: glycosyltransferase [Gemmatimonadaceae bacterium]
MLTLLAVAQGIALVVLAARLLPGRTRRLPLGPVPDAGPPRVTVLLPTLNEAARVRPCIEGLMAQGPTVREIVVIDSHSSDGTADLVRRLAAGDSRVRVVADPPLPGAWIGKVWALQYGLEQTSGDWVLNVDADIEPLPGMVAAAVRAAEELRLDVVSFSPCFAGQTAAEQWLQAALLVTLVYRAGAAPASGMVPAHRTMANGQCFLARRSVLEHHAGYEPASSSFSDDVTLARYLARRGVSVGFLDGSQLFSVRSYRSLGEMWREWGRSLDLKDATTQLRLTADVLFLALVQGAPIAVISLLALGALRGSGAVMWGLLAVNAVLLAVRLGMLPALAGSYDRRHWTYWLSPLADPLAVLKLIASAATRRPKWRGRAYRF